MVYFRHSLNFGHKNIIKYCHRPFKNMDEMDKTMVENWNKVVGPKDLVYHLGDFCSWSGKSLDYYKKFRHYRDQLNGKIFLILGNHDYKVGEPFPFGLEGKTNTLVLREQGCEITLSHYAMRVWNKSHFDSWHLFGHTHGTLPNIGKSIDIGVDSNNFTPVSFEQVKAIMKDRPHNTDWIDKSGKSN